MAQEGLAPMRFQPTEAAGLSPAHRTVLVPFSEAAIFSRVAGMTLEAIEEDRFVNGSPIPPAPPARVLRAHPLGLARAAAQVRSGLERVMTIADIIRRGRGRTHAWRVERDGRTATLWHYGTAMLVWNVERPDDPDTLDWSTGWGSVSDQN